MPSEQMSLREKLEHQRKVRAAWEAAECPDSLPWLPMDAEWHETPFDPSPRQIYQRQERMRKRYERRQ
jgi:hypothetical protein